VCQLNTSAVSREMCCHSQVTPWHHILRVDTSASGRAEACRPLGAPNPVYHLSCLPLMGIFTHTPMGYMVKPDQDREPPQIEVTTSCDRRLRKPSSYIRRLGLLRASTHENIVCCALRQLDGFPSSLRGFLVPRRRRSAENLRTLEPVGTVRTASSRFESPSLKIRLDLDDWTSSRLGQRDHQVPHQAIRLKHVLDTVWGLAHRAYHRTVCFKAPYTRHIGLLALHRVSYSTLTCFNVLKGLLTAQKRGVHEPFTSTPISCICQIRQAMI
jgi:hypothetical protein